MFSPLPGTTPAPQALFVKRWGTLLAVPERGYASGAQDVQFLPGVLQALFRAYRAGWRVYLLGNEDSVAFGKISNDTWKEIEAEILSGLRSAGIAVERSYVCLDHPEGKGPHQLDSVYLLPNTGAFYHSAHVDGIDLPKSWVIGDSTVELVAGWRAGCRLAGVRTGVALTDRVFEVDPELVLEDAAQVIVELLAQKTAVSG